MEVRERDSISCNSPPQSNQESSSRLTSAPSRTRKNDIRDLHFHQGNHYQGFPLQDTNEPYPDPDPAQSASGTPPRPLPPPPPLQQSATGTAVAAGAVVRYHECQRNHAATMGTHVVDGCGEFLPSGEGETPEALKCAACGCHRSFHRRDVEGESQSDYNTRNAAVWMPGIHNPPSRAAAIQLQLAASPHQQQHHRYRHQTSPIMMAFGGISGVPGESSSEDLVMFQTDVGQGQASGKRFRTKFTQEQKNKMHDFAERIGWRIQKQDEQEILQFCNEVGIKRQVFKVWMHNSKQAMKKKEL